MAINAEIPLHIRAEFVATKELAKNLTFSTANRTQLEQLALQNNNKRKMSYIEQIYAEHRDMLDNMTGATANDIDERLPVIYNSCRERPMNPLERKAMAINYIQEIAKTSTKRPTIYTDGSKTEEGSGIGIYIRLHNDKTKYWAIKFKLANNTGITSIELKAIETALETAQQNNIQQPVIYTDSLAACHTIEENQYKTHIETNIYNILKLGTNLKAEIRWIPAHCGIAGNERADELAKRGTTCNNTINNKLSITDIANRARETMVLNTKQWYQKIGQEKGKKFMEFQPNFETTTWHQDIPLTADEIKTTNKLLAGHDLSKYWLTVMKIEQDGNCSTCQEPDTGRHRTFECRNYNRPPTVKFSALKAKWKEKSGSTIKAITRFIRQQKIEL